MKGYRAYRRLEVNKAVPAVGRVEAVNIICTQTVHDASHMLFLEGLQTPYHNACVVIAIATQVR